MTTTSRSGLSVTAPTGCQLRVCRRQRAEGEKVEGLPALEQIRHMMAAGHGGFGSVADSILEAPAFLRRQSDMRDICYSIPDPRGMIMRKEVSIKGRWADRVYEPIQTADGLIEMPAFLRRPFARKAKNKKPGMPKQTAKWPVCTELSQAEPMFRGMLEAFDREAARPAEAEEFLDDLLGQTLPPALRALLGELILIGGSRPAAAALLLDWLSRNLPNAPTLSRQAERVLRAELKLLDAAGRDKAIKAIATVVSNPA